MIINYVVYGNVFLKTHNCEQMSNEYIPADRGFVSFLSGFHLIFSPDIDEDRSFAALFVTVSAVRVSFH